MRAREPTAGRYAVWSGLAVAVLFGVGSAIWGLDMPEDGTPVVDVVDFYRETADRIVIGGSLSLLAIACFLLFAGALRQVLIEAGGEEFLATTAFGGAVLAMAAGIGAESINLVAALRAREAELNEPLAQSLFEISQILGSTATGVGLGVFAVATAAVSLRGARVLSRPPALVILVIGALLLTPLAHANWVAGAAMVLVALLIALGLIRAGRQGSLPAAR